MKYYLENRLIAVGVVDILPNSLSSVYFFYDPDYRKFSLGVYGALKEIEYIKKMKEKYTNFKNYYLGYYIQDSQKMLYKGEYKISELLCPITKNWVELNDDLRKKINEGIKKLSESEKNIKSEEEVSLYIESYVKIR